jgi:hypothetical protein
VLDVIDLLPEEHDDGSIEVAIPAQKKQKKDKGHARKEGPPANAEAEEGLLACCLMSAQEFSRIEKTIGPECFFSPANRVIYEQMLALRDSGMEVDAAILANWLHTHGLLEAVGGIAQIAHITDSAPTTAHATFYVQQVRDMHMLRVIQRGAMGILEEVRDVNGDAPGAIAELRAKLDLLATRASGAKITARPLASYHWPENDASVLLGTKRRFLCRGGSMLIVGFAGMGKSVLCYQMAACFSVGRQLLGIDCVGPLKVLVIQAEDDEGDIGEINESVVHGMQFTKEEQAMFSRNVHVIPDKVHAGESFLAALRTYVKAVKPDLVIINPLLSYAGGDISKQDVASAFLRNGLNAINQENGDQFAYVIIHHTSKPPEDKGGKNKPVSGDHERQYAAFGSSELTNWARAVITIDQRKGTAKPGQYYFNLAKRGSRAGVTRDIPQGAGFRTETITKIPVQHSTQRMDINGKSVPMVFWELGDAELAMAETAVAKEKPAVERAVTGAKPVERDGLLKYFPIGELAAKPLGEIQREAHEKFGLARSSFYHLKNDLLEAQKIFETANGTWHR